jgi:hypothetical protein
MLHHDPQVLSLLVSEHVEALRRDALRVPVPPKVVESGGRTRRRRLRRLWTRLHPAGAA